MVDPVGTRKLAPLILALWMLSGALVATHVHCDCCEHHHADEQPCSICIAVQFAPLIAFAKAETYEAERDVVALITPWIALVPKDAFFDRPLARGPPSSPRFT